MRWSFRAKLILAFLLFSLIPTLLMTLVTFEATEQLKDRAARVIFRNAISAARALTPSVLEDRKESDMPAVNRDALGPVVELFESITQEVQLPSALLVFVGDDMTVL